MNSRILLCHFPATIAIILCAPHLAHAASPVDFNRDVRPILAAKCFGCHGPDEDSREADLRLDLQSAAHAARDGRPAILPGTAAESEVALRISSEDPEVRMPPPPAAGLTAGQIEILTQWINEGGAYETHWSFVRPTRPELPAVENRRWPRHALDNFVLNRIEAAGLQPTPPAEVVTLVRRVYLDLIGLPPLPEELTAFEREVAATSLDAAYGRLVDRLLASPQYGERWARKWLDLARYADTNGYEKDRNRSMWPYRDWVIQALNADMPFDQFTIEQLAGDMLPEPAIEQLVATGFHRNTMLNEEGGIDPLEFRFHAMTDRMATTGATWLGLTLGCAQCHSHKYDPITHHDYYSLMAFLNNADEPEIDLPDAERAARHRQDLEQAERMVAELHAAWPSSDSADHSPSAELQALRERFDKWLAGVQEKVANWKPLRPVRATSNLPLLTIEADDSIFVSGDTTKRDEYVVTFVAPPTPITAVRLEALPDARLPDYGPGMTYYEGRKGDFFLGELRLVADGQPVAIREASHSYAKNQYGGEVSAALTIDGDPQTGWSTYEQNGQRHLAVYVLATPLEEVGELRLTMQFGRHFASSLGRFRISVTGDQKSLKATRLPDAVEPLISKPATELTQVERDRLWETFLLDQAEFAAERAEIERLRRRPEYARALVFRERPGNNPRPTHVHHRGEYLQTRDVVAPAAPAALHAFPATLPRNRLGFAQWLMAEENPLTARVVVNRQWATLFGRGLVETVDDFGTQAASPTHPRLLDWLAVEFVNHGWSLKWLHRTLVNSATYRQSSQVSAAAMTADPDNLLLARAPRPRLPAEVIRDSLLRASGLLSLEMGGPGVHPPQPAGVTEVAWGKPEWKASQGADRYRRSIYTFRKRTAPFAMYDTFDAPSGEACTARRDISNTPLQALTVLNDTMIFEAAQALGALLAASASDDATGIETAFRRVLSRPPTAEEAEMLQRFVATQRGRFARGELDATQIAGERTARSIETATWTTLARALFGLDESLTRN